MWVDVECAQGLHRVAAGSWWAYEGLIESSKSPDVPGDCSYGLTYYPNKPGKYKVKLSRLLLNHKNPRSFKVGYWGTKLIEKPETVQQEL